MNNDQNHQDEEAVGHKAMLGRTADAGTAAYQAVITARSDTSALSNVSETEIEAVLRNANVKIALKA